MAFILLLVASTAGAQTQKVKVRFFWDQNPEPDIASYSFFIGLASGEYGEPRTVLPTDLYEWEGVSHPSIMMDLDVETSYFAVVTAKNTAGLESLPSDELIFDTPSRPSKPAFPVIIRINADGSAEILEPRQLSILDLPDVTNTPGIAE